MPTRNACSKWRVLTHARLASSCKVIEFPRFSLSYNGFGDGIANEKLRDNLNVAGIGTPILERYA